MLHLNTLDLCNDKSSETHCGVNLFVIECSKLVVNNSSVPLTNKSMLDNIWPEQLHVEKLKSEFTLEVDGMALTVPCIYPSYNGSDWKPIFTTCRSKRIRNLTVKTICYEMHVLKN